MESRAITAAGISVAILLVWHLFVVPRFFPEQHEIPPPAVEAPLPVAETGAKEKASPDTAPLPVPIKEDAAKVEELVASEARDVTIETDLYRAVFTTAGARLKSFQLKQYRATVAPDSPPLEVIVQAIPGDLPLGVGLRSPGGSITDAGVLFAVDRDALQLAAGAMDSIVFTGTLDGATITKKVTFDGDRYLLGADVQVVNPPSGYTETAITWNKRLDPNFKAGHEVVFDSALAVDAKDLHKNDFTATKKNDLDEGIVYENHVQWVGYGGHYFLAALAPAPEEQGAEHGARAWLKRRPSSVEAQVLLPAGHFKSHLDIYIGPKRLDILEQAGHGFQRAVDLGFFSIVARPLLEVLKFLYRITGNHGIDIILLTLAIKLAFFPLTRSSMKSMKAMQQLQPQMNEMKERYKDRPDELNRQIMELYKRHGVNPLGGCLPMVIQIPVFVGLYQAFANAIELRHAPFFGWITDLSAPDRLGSMQIPGVNPEGFPVMTLLMGGSMFLQQWMAPSPGDPMQQRMMLIMPLMFTYMFINFPSGLTLYWLVNNLVTIAQQYLIQPADSKAK